MPGDASTPARFAVRAYAPGDEAAILDLFARSFHAPRSLAQWQWKYEHDPFGREHISLAFDDDRLAGHYAGYPVPFIDGGEELVAHQIGDTMTDPAIRHIGRGATSVLGRTALHFYEHFCEDRVAFNYGFNVANIQKFSLRFLRSDRVEPVTYRTLAASALAPLSRFERRARGWSLEQIRSATPELDGFFARVASDYGFLVKRDARYLQWRYFDAPDAPYIVIAVRKWRRLAGWIVFRIRDDRFTIGDALFDRHFPDALGILLRHVVRGYPVANVEAWFPPRPAWFSNILTELGFAITPEPQDLSVMCVPFMKANAVARMRESLYYTWGDSDLF